RVWDAATGEELTVLHGHAGPLNSATFSPDGQSIVTASEDGTARLWDAATGGERAILHGHTWEVNSAVFSPDGQWIATTSRDGTVRQYILDSEQLLALAAHRITRSLTLDERATYLDEAILPSAPDPESVAWNEDRARIRVF